MTTLVPTEGESPVMEPPVNTTEAPPPAELAPPPVSITLDPVVPLDDAVSSDALAPVDDTPRDIEPPFEPPPPPDRTRYRAPEPYEGDRTPPGVPLDQSSYLEYLPGIYQTNHFLGRFLLIFESILGPVDRTVENVHHYFDPYVTPPEVLNWLGGWLGLVLDDRWPEERRRDLIAAATSLYQWRGTKYGLSEFLRLYTGIEPEIIEPTLRDISANRARTFRFTVRMRIPKGRNLNRSLIESIIDAEKPAFSACTLELIEE